MGLLDILNGMQNGSRGEPQPGSGTSSGGMSPMTMALLGVLAYKAYQSFAGAKPAAAPASPSDPQGSGITGAETTGAGTMGADTGGGILGGGLGGILGRLFGGGQRAGGAPAGGLEAMIPGGIGGLLGGAAAGGLVTSGLGTLLRELQESGHAHEAQSWVGTGPNQAIEPNDLGSALGGDTLDALTRQTGMNRADLLSGLSQHLPELVNQLTPDGRLPTEEEASRMV